MPDTNIEFFWCRQSAGRDFRTGVSIHSHTMYSEESLASIPGRISRLPCLGRHIVESARFEFTHAFWTPPLSPRQAYRLEERHINTQFQLAALVSLTDHDDARSATLLRVIGRFSDTPISTEWSVPFGPTTFHVGVHNLPPVFAKDIHTELSRYTRHPEEAKLHELLGMLNSYPDVLLVLNHPLWDEDGLGSARHCGALWALLKEHRASFHALELNGLRPWRENQQVIRLARDVSLPAVSGGDRHGLEPNSILNLSCARSFAEFVHEIRYRQSSHVCVMPQYREPHALRIARMVAEILDDYPHIPGRHTWADRVFIREFAGSSPIPLSSFWKTANRAPKLLDKVVQAVHLTNHRRIRWALRLAFSTFPSARDYSLTS